ncbi:MAG: hypothetical protein PHE15_02565 [Dehalococcoidales bacterium]|nr:hypothetical protein [Dehalococcoidales bacterium]
MAKVINPADSIEKNLPAELVAFLQLAGKRAAARQEKLYLVGGVVRDLLLGKTNLDIDLAVEGNAIALAKEMADKQDNITVHKNFYTAKIRWHDLYIDFAATRRETYANPGALPTVSPSSLIEDLIRRDFTINAMAIGLTGQDYGLLYDPYNGQEDLINRGIRILHDKSFIDDSTRIWRGLRYEQRLGFQIEPHTLELLKRDIPMLDTVSADRIYYEIECILKEELPEKVFKRAHALGILKKLHPDLKADSRLDDRFPQAREVSFPHRPSPALYMALLTYDLNITEKEELNSYLRLPKLIAQTMRDSDSIKSRFKYIATTGIKRSEIYHLLYDYSLQAIMASIIVAETEEVRQNLRLYLDKLRSIKPLLTGKDLLKMGVTQGPHMREILNSLLDAKLDDRVKTREDEERIVKNKYSK